MPGLRRTYARTALVLLLVAGSAPVAGTSALANSGGNQTVGGFEIDGNFYEGYGNATTATGPDADPVDWGSAEIAGDVDTVVDPTGNTDETIFDSGSKEDDLATWTDDGSAAAPGNGDIARVYAYDRVTDDSQIVYLGLERATTTGSVTWYAELNQLANTTNDQGVAVPDRVAGDLRLTMANRTGNAFAVHAVERWSGTGWEAAGDDGVTVAVNDSTITTPSGGDVRRDRFGEFALDIPALLGGSGCAFDGYSTFWVRSKTGVPTAAGELKDYVTGTVDVADPCGTLTIEKHDADGEPLAGATFTVEPNPMPGAADPDTLTIEDDDANDADPADGVIVVDPALPGDYAVTETAPPPGYVQDDEPQNVTLADGGSGTVTFVNTLGSIAWTKVDADTGDPVCCATFTVEGTAGAAEGDTHTVVDNGENDADPADGAVLVEDLPTGTYTVTETEPPTGYDLPAEPARTDVVVGQDTPDAVIAAAFQDPQVRSALVISKTDATTGASLAGARFVVRVDDGDGVFEADEDAALDPPGEVVTDAAGSVTVDGLLFGTYWVEETAAPTGYQLPDPAHSGPYTFGPDDTGESVAVAVENEQKLTDLSVRKLDGQSDTPLELAGAQFDLVNADGDEVVGSCTTGDDGVCTVEDLGFGSYYWVESVPPTGFDLPEDPTSELVTVTAENAGTEIEPLAFFNPRKPGRLAVLKVDDSDDAPLAGAQFDLVNEDGDEVVGSCTTGDDGTCAVGDLAFGTYHWVETAAPTGYALPDDATSESVVVDASTVDSDVESVVFHDPRLRSELTVRKVDAVDGTGLAGAEFELIDDDGDDDIVGHCTTGDDGTCTVGDLGFGSYTWVETAAPTGYALPDDPTSDPVVIDASNAGGELTQVVVHDPRLLSELSVHKVAEDTGDSLPGAVFDLVLADDAGGDVVVGTCTTGDDGLCSVAGLDFGDYHWVEITAPDGYLLPGDVTSETVTITAENAGTDMAAMTFVDPPDDGSTPSPSPTSSPTGPGEEPSGSPSPTPDEPDLPDTGPGGPLRLVALLAAVALVVGVAVRWRSRRAIGG